LGDYRREYLGTLSWLPPGLPGTDVTVERMGELARSGARLPALRLIVEDIVRKLPARDWTAEALAVEDWIRRRLRFTRDGLNVETLKTVPKMLADLARTGRLVGDCDDASILGAAMLLSLGHPVSFQVLGRGKKPHHVNVLDTLSGRTVDPTGEPSGFFGFRKLYKVA